MNWELILSILSCLATVAAIVFGYYVTIRRKIEQEALGAINGAEDTDKVKQEKMEHAVATVYDTLPAVAKPFISKALIETVIQGIFDKMEEYAKKQVKEDSAE